MSEHLSLEETQKEWPGTLRSYLIGFSSCIVLTGISFLLVGLKLLSGNILIGTIVALALVQAICQLLFFLHLGHEEKPHWKTLIFYCMLMILLIIAIGSLWIMFDLKTRVMPG